MKCEQCNAEYEPKRSTSRFCGAKCRKLAFQAKDKVSVPSLSVLGIEQPDIPQLPPGVSIPTGQRDSETQHMTSEHLQDHMRRYDHDTWLASPEYAEVTWRLLNHTIEQLKADDQFIPAWRRAKGEAA